MESAVISNFNHRRSHRGIEPDTFRFHAWRPNHSATDTQIVVYEKTINTWLGKMYPRQDRNSMRFPASIDEAIVAKYSCYLKHKNKQNQMTYVEHTYRKRSKAK